jgi:polysaccharide biosynthesis/export protein
LPKIAHDRLAFRFIPPASNSLPESQGAALMTRAYSSRGKSQPVSTAAYCIAAWWAAWAVLAFGGGCHATRPFDPYATVLEEPVSPMLEPPREKAKVSLPAYQIEPPDILQLEALKLVPKPPYRVETYDVLQIQVLNTLLDQPIDGYYLVEGEGTVNLGAAYGKLRVVGMTIDEVSRSIDQYLRQILVRPVVSVQLARTSGTQPVTGNYLVSPDGTINLRHYGVVHVAGMTVTQARIAIQQHLAQYFDAPDVSVDVLGYNSKVYYIVTQGAKLGDNIVRVPVTGNETVLDAIAQLGGISQVSSTNIWIARPAPGSLAMEQILPVNYEAITRGGSAATNYQLMPGDRLYIAEDGLVAFSGWMTKILGPAERLLGISSLGTSTARGFQTMGRQFNLQRRSG